MGSTFVTGGSGFLGGRLIEILASREEVRGLARSEAAANRIRARGGEPVAGDLDSIAALSAGMAGCSTVYHCAAKADDWGSAAEFDRINVEGTRNVIAAARSARVSRLVFVSTEAQFAGGPMANLTEDSVRPAKPVGHYARTKGLAEDIVLAASGDGLTTCAVRPRFIWGPGDTSVLPRLVEMTKKGQLKWIAGGKALTSSCYVDNCVEGMLLAAEHAKGGQAYFLSDGETLVSREFLSELLRTQGVEPPTASVPLWAARSAAWTIETVWKLFGVQRPPPLTRMAVCLVGQDVTISDARARQELGYRGTMSVRDGLAAMMSA